MVFMAIGQCGTGSHGRKAKILLVGAALLGASVSTTAATSAAWPPFLAPPETFSSDIVDAVERVWLDPTLVRRVRGRPAHVPFEVYVAFIDAPDVTAAAARHLGLVRYEVDALGGDWYRADDNDGARGIYRVIERNEHRRVMLSWGEHTGRFLSAVSGSALSLVDLEPDGQRVNQRITAYVRIDNAVAATLARILAPVFGTIGDRKLAEGFAVTAKVAEWAMAKPREFCDWLGRQPLPEHRRASVMQVIGTCS